MNCVVAHFAVAKYLYGTPNSESYLLSSVNIARQDSFFLGTEKPKIWSRFGTIERRRKRMALIKRIKATSIPPAVKQIVAERDKIMNFPACVICGRHAPADHPTAWSNAHYISRAHGGLGIPENVVTLCPECHRAFDQSADRREIKFRLAGYLRSHYPEWNEESLVFRKGAL